MAKAHTYTHTHTDRLSVTGKMEEWPFWVHVKLTNMKPHTYQFEATYLAWNHLMYRTVPHCTENEPKQAPRPLMCHFISKYFCETLFLGPTCTWVIVVRVWHREFVCTDRCPCRTTIAALCAAACMPSTCAVKRVQRSRSTLVGQDDTRAPRCRKR